MIKAHTIGASAKILIGLVALLCFFPTAANAAVIINEIAWMGTSVSANDEWIELYNDGAAVDLSGHTLSDGALSIALEGTIGENAYFLLERTDDETVPGKTADIIYTGALSNTGATLTLKTASGSTLDSVVSGENWSTVGGDNATKETAQKTASGWTTGSPTPKAANVAYTPKAEISSAQGSNSQTQSTQKKSVEPKVALQISDTKLKISIEGGKYAYVNQPAVFYAKAAGVTGKIYDSLVYSWSFGDATGKRGSKVTHIYTHPGKYVVVLSANYITYEASARLEVEVLPLTLSLSRVENGTVVLENSAGYEVDVSGATLRGGDQSFLLPSNTVLLPDASLAIPSEGFTKLPLEEELTLKDRAGILLAKYPAPEISPPDEAFEELAKEKEEIGEERPEEDKVPENKDRDTPLPPPVAFAEDAEGKLGDGEAARATQVATAIESKQSSKVLPYVGFLGIVLVGLLALYARRLV